jgi:hypothetical protein
LPTGSDKKDYSIETQINISDCSVFFADRAKKQTNFRPVFSDHGLPDAQVLPRQRGQERSGRAEDVAQQRSQRKQKRFLADIKIFFSGLSNLQNRLSLITRKQFKVI